MGDRPINTRLDRSSAIAIAATVVGVLAAAGALYAMWARLGIVFIGGHITLAAFSVFLVIANNTSAPLGTLIESARRVADGDLGVHLDLGSRADLVELSEAFNSMASALQRHTQDLTHKIEELSTLYDMSCALGTTLDLDVLLESTLDAALRSFAVGSGYVVLRDGASGELVLRARRGTKELDSDDRAVRSSMSEWVVEQGRPLIFNPPQGGAKAENVDSITGALAAVCVPLNTSEGVVGAIAVGSRDRGVRFTGEDVRMLSTIANHLTVAIGNTELFASLQDAYLATVRSLAAAVDAKEPHMRGHSEHVALYARATAERMGLSHEQRTAIEMAAYLHDIGKIGISELILRKPGPLDGEEVATMRHHPLIGANILRPVTFPWPIAPVVRHHHERFDGTGYPAGLRGEEIPLLARILSVADAYEAMISDRPYRKRLSVDDAVHELHACSGTHFDPKVVDALVCVLPGMGEEVRGPGKVGMTVDTFEARAVFVALVDSMLASFRRLGGPRLASNLESAEAVWIALEHPAFSLSASHMSAAWEHVGDAEEAATMRGVLLHLGDSMAVITGRSLVDHFYREAVDSLTERLRRSADQLALYSRG